MAASILGMGNALTDIFTHLPDDSLLEKYSLKKGGMHHVDLVTAQRLWRDLQPYGMECISGGSASNTVAVTAALGLRSRYIGKVGEDEAGDIFERGLEETGVDVKVLRCSAPSGRAVVLISPQSEQRTFVTHLGAALEFGPDDLRGEFFDGCDYLHLEGYLMHNQPLVERGVKMAKERGMVVSIDLASHNIVERNNPFLHKIVKGYADIVFANELEAEIFTGKGGVDALDELARLSSVAVVKLGERGSLVRSGNEFYTIAPYPAKVVDTTGAGDVYQAAFLYAHSLGADIDVCAKAGSFAASKVIETIGPKIYKSVLKTTKEKIETFLRCKD